MTGTLTTTRTGIPTWPKDALRISFGSSGWLTRHTSGCRNSVPVISAWSRVPGTA